MVYGVSEGGGGANASPASAASGGRIKPLVTQLSFDTRDLQVGT